eukprot:jgi/Tetstr1/425170/TSEL_015631.t1
MECFPLPRHALAAALPLLLLAVAAAACSGTVVAADGGSKQALESTGSLLATTVGGGEERPPRRLSESESESEELVLEVRMPGVTTDSMDEYHCVNVELPDEPLNLVEIESLSDQGLVHHMLLWGCREPSNPGPVYKCGMQARGTCKGSVTAPLYGWGKNAPMMHYPDGVGVQVGPGTHIQMIVLEIHYLEVVDHPDITSGVRLRLSRRAQERAGGLASLAAGFYIPPGRPAHHVGMWCCVNSMMPVRGFAMRAHTHSLGRSVKLNHAVRNGSERLVVDQDPQEPQGFYPLPNGELLLPRGSKLTASCTFDSTSRETTTAVGYTHNDEMCNSYLMLHSELPFYSNCAGRGASDGGSWRVQSPIMGQVAGIEAVEGGRLWVFHRGSRVWDSHSFAYNHRTRYEEPIKEDCILEVDRDSGAVLRSWGAGVFYMPHGLTIDHEGNLWLTDTGLHQVFKFAPDGTKLLELGVKLEPDHSENGFCMPTQVAVALNGEFYVADGYCNSRVAHFSAAGELIRVLGHGSEHPMRIPHSLVLDECHDRLLVADRLNSLVRVFQLTDGKELHRAHVSTAELGHPYALTPGPYGSIFALLWQAPGKSFVARLDTQTLMQHLGTLRLTAHWEISSADTSQGAPHDIALIPDAHSQNEVRERAIAMFVGDTTSTGGGSLFRFDWEQQQVEPGMAGSSGWLGVSTNLRTRRAATTVPVVASGPTDEDGEPTILLHDEVDVGEAIWQLYMYGVPLGLLLAGVAFFLWRSLGDMQPR